MEATTKPLSLTGRMLAGAFMGSLIGLLQLIVRADLRYVAAAVIAGAFCGALVGAFALRSGRVSFLIVAIAGALAGVVWWLVSGSPTFVLVPVVLGTIAAPILLRSS